MTGAVRVGRSTAAGIGAAAVAAGLVFVPLAAVVWRADAPAGLEPADWAALRFTLTQAGLSAILSATFAVPVARALARRRFPGRRALVTLMGAPFILPVIVAVFGLLAIFGRGGLINDGLGLLGLGPVSIYGLPGIVLAHVFFNLPLVTRLLLEGWAEVPGEQFRLAAALRFRDADIRRHIERPILRRVLPGAMALVFALAMTSFAVALTLGGGPASTTIELAIYQAFRFEADLAGAARLAMLQLALSGAVAVAALALGMPAPGIGGIGRAPARWDGRGRRAVGADVLAIAAAALLLVLPLAAVLWRGVPHMAGLPASIWAAAVRSLAVACAATLLTLAVALPMALAAARLGAGARRGAVILSGTLSVALSPLVLGAGIFILILPVAEPARLALPVTATVNALLALPFALRALAPAAIEMEARHGRIADSLRMTGMARLRLVTLPLLARPLRFAAALAAALSMGDLGVIALFADASRATLPLALEQLMASYRMDAAAGAALLLLLLSLGLFWLIDRGGGGDAAA